MQSNTEKTKLSDNTANGMKNDQKGKEQDK